MTADKKENLSEKEAQLYDRQIRLWGVEAQRRLRNARVLICNLRGLAAEVAKNLVLAGVEAVTVADAATLSQDDLHANFLAPKEKVGQNRGEACLDRLRNLNPMVEVSSDARDLSELDEAFFAGFDVVVAVSSDERQLRRADEDCRKAGVKFYAGDVVGYFGWAFADLGDKHEFTEEVVKTTEVEGTGGSETAPSKEPTIGEPEKKRPRVEAKKEVTQETEVVHRAIRFSPLHEALAADWKDDPFYAKKVRRMDPAFFIMQMCLNFYAHVGRYPQAGERLNEDTCCMENLRRGLVEHYDLKDAKIPDGIVPLLVAGGRQLSPACAVTGGVLAQEVIKAISHKDAPHDNFFLYNPITSAGVVERIGYGA